MKINFNLDLSLVPPSLFSHSADHNGRYNSMFDSERLNEKKPLTIFYNGKVASLDATELQARTLIFLASKEIEEKSKNGLGLDFSPSPWPNSPICSPSMKRSLQMFLEKRKTRAQSFSPYPIIRHHTEN